MQLNYQFVKPTVRSPVGLLSCYAIEMHIYIAIDSCKLRQSNLTKSVSTHFTIKSQRGKSQQ
ncbi:MAG: hypothetical protein RMX59_004565 [Nostoc sp. DedSLP05]|nr:hypothetical protein [Nostoc sp. DedSLP05]MDZ8098230.1 hypothetical protein [Nostoc sp. DedSLP01]